MVFVASTTSFTHFPSFREVSTGPSNREVRCITFSVVRASFPARETGTPPLPPSPVVEREVNALVPLVSWEFLTVTSPYPFSSTSVPKWTPSMLAGIVVKQLGFSTYFVEHDTLQ